MQCPRFIKLLACAGFAACALASAPSHAQKTWPDHPIRMIVPFAPGSAADSLARLVANELGKRLGQAVVIDNKGGAGGTIGTAEIARATADGYVIGLAAQGTFVNNQVLYTKTGYDSLNDFAYVAELADVQNVLVVSSEAPYKSIAELIKAIHAKPSEAFKYSSSGVGTSHHIAGATMADFLHKPMLHVPYTGAPQGLTAVMTGDVDMGLYNLPAALGLIKSGKLRALAVTGPARSALLPEVPTLDQAGLKGYSVTLWWGVVGPKGMPAEIVARLHDELNAVMERPDIRKQLADQGFGLTRMPLTSPAEFRDLVSRDMDQWIPFIKKLDIAPN